MSGRPGALQRVPGLARLAQRQAGVVSRAQLQELGVGERAVAHQVAAQRWQTVGPLVLAAHTGELTAPARRWAAVLSSPSPRALCAWTSLELWGLTRWERPDVHLVVPRGWSPVALPWLRVHESRRHSSGDVTTRDGLAVHPVERSAVDAASWSKTPREASGLLAAVVQKRLSTPGRLLAELEKTHRVRHRRVMVSALDDIAGGSHSMAEIDVVRMCRRNGLPVPDRQRPRKDALGRNRYLDVEWTLPDGRTVLLEIDGGLHMEVSLWADDGLRAAEVTAPGETVLRLSALVVRAEERRVVAALRRHLGLGA